jgi:hypothetical protein
LSSAAEQAFQAYLERRIRQPHFANARSVRNALDRARLRQANRLCELAEIDRDQAMTIEADDILQSRVFDAATATLP